MSIETKAALIALTVAVALLGAAFGAAPLLREPSPVRAKERSDPAVSGTATDHLQGEARLGQRLFQQNCAHCHGDDARGDEGPSLYNVRKTDARIAKLIQQGIKGEMPKFGEKFSDADVRALIAFIRTLKS